MIYKVIRRFRDLKHNHVYEIGDVYPAKGKKASKARIQELSTTANKNGKVYIEVVESGGI